MRELDSIPLLTLEIPESPYTGPFYALPRHLTPPPLLTETGPVSPHGGAPSTPLFGRVLMSSG